MNSGLIGKITYHCAILLACFTLGARPQQPVVLTQGENDLVVLNGCVVSLAMSTVAPSCQRAHIRSAHSTIAGASASILA